MNQIDRAFRNAKLLPICDASRIVLFSDCHRGYGGWSDSFAVNATAYFAALRHYDRNGFTYIELGDGDELWENRRFSEISAAHCDVFRVLAKLNSDGRLIMLYGNHDIDKRRRLRLMDRYYDTTETVSHPLFPAMPVHESLLLHHISGYDIFLLHGHQADFFNSRLWLLSRFLVRYIWKPLQIVGMKAPAAREFSSNRRLKTERRLADWAIENHTLTVAGHTHRPRLPAPDEGLYCNDGSCVHPRCITAIEISSGAISLVSWSTKTRPDGNLYIGRDILAGPHRIANYYKAAR